MNSTAQPTATTPLVLVVEDEPAIASILTAYLERDGLRSRMASDGQEALQLFRLLRPDLVLLDIHLPGMDGIDVLRAIRDDSQTPVIMVTALADDVDKLLALRLGADDYVVKPFSPRELVLRIRAVLKRAQGVAENPQRSQWQIDGLALDLDAHRVEVDGEEAALTATEFRLLAELVRNRGRVRTRDQLLNTVWGYEFEGYARTVDTHVRRLRQKIGGYAAMIETIRGVGYRFKEQ